MQKHLEKFFKAEVWEEEKYAKPCKKSENVIFLRNSSGYSYLKMLYRTWRYKSLILQTTYSQPTFFILVNILIQSYGYKIKTMSHINFDCVILCSLVLPIFLFFILILLSLKQYCYFVWDKIEINNEL